MITTTLNRIREQSPCSQGWSKLLAHLGKTKADDEPLPFATILASNGLDDAAWCCRAEPQHSKEWRLFAVRCARRVQHLMLDQRSIDALDVSERYANWLATDAELSAARVAALGAAWDAASDAARDAARDAAWAVARDAALAAAWAVARGAARDAMTADFLCVVGSGE